MSMSRSDHIGHIPGLDDDSNERHAFLDCVQVHTTAIHFRSRSRDHPCII